MFSTLLLAVDVNDTAGASRCAAAAVTMARAEGAKLHILNVVPDSGMAIVGASLSADHADHELADARAELTSWASKTIAEDIASEMHVAMGTVYDQIIKAANTLEVDAIFVGAHRPEFRDYLIGPNSARVARHASQSVFVIR
jgi:nucleotide-binding universal stress UspA family protein